MALLYFTGRIGGTPALLLGILAVVFLVTSFVGWCSDADRAHRKSGEHLDAYLPVSGIDELHAELVGRGGTIMRPLENRPWGTRDFYVEDPDGYILCFSELL